MKKYLFFLQTGANPMPRAMRLKNDDGDRKSTRLFWRLAKMRGPIRTFPISINENVIELRGLWKCWKRKSNCTNNMTKLMEKLQSTHHAASIVRGGDFSARYL